MQFRVAQTWRIWQPISSNNQQKQQLHRLKQERQTLRIRIFYREHPGTLSLGTFELLCLGLEELSRQVSELDPGGAIGDGRGYLQVFLIMNLLVSRWRLWRLFSSRFSNFHSV